MRQKGALDSGTAPPPPDPSLWTRIRVPGLTGSDKTIEELRTLLPKELAVQAQKRHKPFLWVVLLGGTGTGKSTVFNLLCGTQISYTGVERPMTSGPVAYAHRDLDLKPYLPFFLPSLLPGSTPPAVRGEADNILLVEHDQDALSHLVLVDTPDLDSLVCDNQRLAEDLFLLADVVVFVASQEKYADEVLVRVLQRVASSDRPWFLLVNKVEQSLEDSRGLIEDLRQSLDPNEAFLKPDRIWLLPFTDRRSLEALTEDPCFGEFFAAFSRELSDDAVPKILLEQGKRHWERTRREVERLRQLLLKEEQAAEQWLGELESLCQSSKNRLLDRAEKRFQDSGRKHIQAEIRRLFTRYDLLARPRRAVVRMVRLPFRLLLAPREQNESSRKEALEEIRRKAEMEPALHALDELQRFVLEKLSPRDPALPLHSCLRSSETLVSRKEAARRIQGEQEALAAWLQERFRTLSREVPKSRIYGIYSTSILWGVLLISFETVVGGGLTLIDALVDSALAPFLTQGAVELFVYREVQTIARELAERYRKALISTLELQKERFADCLNEQRPPREVLDGLRTVSRPSTAV